MLLPIVIVGTAVFGGTKAVRSAGQAMFGSAIVSGQRAKAKEKELKREHRLGLNSEKEKWRLEKYKSLREKGGEAVAEMAYGSSIAHLTLTKEEFPGLKAYHGEYLLFEDEMSSLADALRHESIANRTGDVAAAIDAFCVKYGCSYEDVDEVVGGQGHGVDLEWLQKVSKERLKDDQFRQLAGLPPLKGKKSKKKK